MTVSALMLACKELGNSPQRCPWADQRDCQFEGLPDVFGIDGTIDQWQCRLAHQASRLIRERFESTLEVILGQFRQRRIECSDKVMLEFSFEKADCAEHPRRWRHQ